MDDIKKDLEEIESTDYEYDEPIIEDFAFYAVEGETKVVIKNFKGKISRTRPVLVCESCGWYGQIRKSENIVCPVCREKNYKKFNNYQQLVDTYGE